MRGNRTTLRKVVDLYLLNRRKSNTSALPLGDHCELARLAVSQEKTQPLWSGIGSVMYVHQTRGIVNFRHLARDMVMDGK